MRLTLATPNLATSASRPSITAGWTLSASMSTARRRWSSGPWALEVIDLAMGILARGSLPSLYNGARPRLRLLRAIDVHRLDVDEFADAMLGQLAAEARGLGAAERQAHVAAHDRVDERRADLQAARDRLAGGGIARPHAAAEPEGGVVGHAHGLVGIAHAQHAGDRAEQFLRIRRHAGAHVAEDRRGIVRGARQRLAAQQRLRAGGD